MRVEVLGGVERRRRWSHDDKTRIIEEAPIASEAVRRIDMLFEIERSINGKTPEQRLAVRRERSRPLVAELEIWMRQQRSKHAA
jgi:threonyl-tRNA synthetase